MRRGRARSCPSRAPEPHSPAQRRLRDRPWRSPPRSRPTPPRTSSPRGSRPRTSARCRRIARGLPLGGAARDLQAARLLVEEQRDAHAARARDLFDEPGDVLVASLGSLDVAGTNLGPDELAAVLADETGECEAPELERL